MRGRASSVETLIAIVGDISSFIPVAVVLTLIFEGGVTLIMILWRLYMRQQEAQIEQARAEALAEGRVEGRVEGRAEAYQLWSAWNERRLEAETNKRPFDEPPPPPEAASK